MCLHRWDVSELERGNRYPVNCFSELNTDTFPLAANPPAAVFFFFKGTKTQVAGYWCHQSGVVAVVLYVGLAMRPSDVSQQGTWAYRDGEDGIIYLIVNYLSLI